MEAILVLLAVAAVALGLRCYASATRSPHEPERPPTRLDADGDGPGTR